MTYTGDCGTLRGAIAHQTAGEPLCGWCVLGEAAAALAAEGLPRPSGMSHTPVTPGQAALNRGVLDAEVEAYERDHPHAFDNRRVAPLRLAGDGRAA